MHKVKQLPTTAYLHTRLEYNPETGIFYWKKKPILRKDDKRWNKMFSGKEAGGKFLNGYIAISIDYQFYMASRVAYKIFYGDFDETLEIDHINGNPADNRIANLRPVMHGQNQQNRVNTKGYTLHTCGKWQAQIRTQYLGLFDTEEEAREAYLTAADALFGEFATHNSRNLPNEI